MNFTETTFFVGIDIAKLDFTACLLTVDAQRKQQSITHTFDNTELALSTFIEWLNKHQIVQHQTIICLENTGMYDDQLLNHLCLLGFQVAVEKTTILLQYRGKDAAKDDLKDAIDLADYAYRHFDKLNLYKPKSDTLQTISLFYEERRRYVTFMAGLKQRHNELGYNMNESRQNQLGYTKVKEDLAEQIAYYKALIKKIDERILSLIKQDEDLHRRYKLLLKIPGVGKVIATFFLKEHGQKDKLDAKQLSSLYGFAPKRHESGKSVHRKPRSTGHGNSEARKILSQGALSAQFYYEHYKSYRARKQAEGKHPLVINNNIINKMLKTICIIWNTGAEYSPSYQSKFA
jgi:transposase